MTSYPNDRTPRTFREVAIVIGYLADELADVKESVDKMNSLIKWLAGLVFTGIVAPVIVLMLTRNL